MLLCMCVFFPQTTRIEFDLPEYCVRRRYQDFDWLRIKLEDSQPTHLIPVGPDEPGRNLNAVLLFLLFFFFFYLHSLLFLALSVRPQPLPEKFVMKGVVDRFSEEFVETRMKALDKFLKRVADHPVLSFNPHLNAFLSAKVRQHKGGRFGTCIRTGGDSSCHILSFSVNFTQHLVTLIQIKYGNHSSSFSKGQYHKKKELRLIILSVSS